MMTNDGISVPEMLFSDAMAQGTVARLCWGLGFCGSFVGGALYEPFQKIAPYTIMGSVGIWVIYTLARGGYKSYLAMKGRENGYDKALDFMDDLENGF